MEQLIRLRGKLLRKMSRVAKPSDADRAELKDLEYWIDLRIKELKQGGEPDL